MMTDPAQGSALLDLSTTDQTVSCKGLFIEGAGAVHFKGMDGNDDTWVVPAGCYIDVRITKVYHDSTATGVHALSGKD